MINPYRTISELRQERIQMAKKSDSMVVKDESGTALANTDSKDMSLFYEGDIEELYEANGFSARHVVVIPQGKTLVGTFKGLGDGMEFTDPGSGEVRTVQTFVIEVKKGIEAELIGCHQLERKLSKVTPGSLVAITRGPKVRTRLGREVNDYLVAKP